MSHWACSAGKAAGGGCAPQITLVQADLRDWRPAGVSYALVLCTGYWDRAVFATAVTAVAPDGVLAWEAFTAGARRARPGLCPDWCLADGEPVSLLGAGFAVLDVRDLPDGGRGPKRAMLARRLAARHGPDGRASRRGP